VNRESATRMLTVAGASFIAWLVCPAIGGTRCQIMAAGGIWAITACVVCTIRHFQDMPLICTPWAYALAWLEVAFGIGLTVRAIQTHHLGLLVLTVITGLVALGICAGIAHLVFADRGDDECEKMEA